MAAVVRVFAAVAAVLSGAVLLLRRRTRVLGLTGGIGCGKSTAAALLCAAAPQTLHIDADAIAKAVVRRGQPAFNDIVRAFGAEVVGADGELNRERLGRIIFGDERKRRLLNKLTHGRVFRAIAAQVLRAVLQGRELVLLDVPLLFESGVWFRLLTTETVVIACEEGEQLRRVVVRNGLPEEQALQRIRAQMPQEAKCRLATFVVDNSGALEALQPQLDNVVAQVRSRARRPDRVQAALGTLCAAAFISFLAL